MTFPKPTMQSKLWILPLLLLGLSGCLDNGGSGAYVSTKLGLKQAESHQSQARWARAAALKTSMIMAVPSTVTASQAMHYSRPENVFDQALESLDSSSVTLRLPVGESLKLLKFTFSEDLTLAQIETQQPLPYNISSSEAFEINAKTSELAVTLFSNDLVFNHGRIDTAQGRYKISMTGKQAFDPGRYHFGRYYLESSETGFLNDDSGLWTSFSGMPDVLTIVENDNKTLTSYPTMNTPHPRNANIVRGSAIFADNSLHEQQATTWLEPKRATKMAITAYNAEGAVVTPTCTSDPTLYTGGCPSVTSEHQYEEIDIEWTDGLPTITRTIKTSTRSLYKMVETYSAHPTATMPESWAFSVYYPEAAYYKTGATLYANTAANTATTTTWTAAGSWSLTKTYTPSATGLSITTTETCFDSNGTEGKWSATLENYSSGAVKFSESDAGGFFNTGNVWANTVSCSLSNSSSKAVDTLTYTLNSESNEVTYTAQSVDTSSDTLQAATVTTETRESWATGRVKTYEYASYTDQTFATLDSSSDAFSRTYEKGMQTASNTYSVSNNTKTLSSTINYTYDDQLRLSGYQVSSWANGVEEPSYQVVYSRDDNGRISSERSYAYSAGAYSSTAYCSSLSSGGRALNYSYSFPDAGGMTVTVQSFCNETTLTTTAQNQWTATYNAKGLITNKTQYTLSGTTFQVSQTVDYTYDDNDNLTLAKTTEYIDGTASTASGEAYSYDDQNFRTGSWTITYEGTNLSTATVNTDSQGYTSTGTLVNFNNRAVYTYQ